MQSKLGDIPHSSLKTFGLSVLGVFLLFAWQGNAGFNLWDEGFLWYGVKRVLLNEVPIRDFMAYDPGRYYWSASWMAIFGDNGIMSLRVSVAIFQVLGLFVGMLLIAQSVKNNKKNRFFLIMSAVTMMVWMFPRHKLFDISLSIFLIGILTFLVRNPSLKRYFIVGICIGLVAVFGRNHGMYGVVGSLGIMLWLNIKRSLGPNFFKGFMLWGSGVAVGFLPIIFIGVMKPSFAITYWESIRFMFEQKATNIALPVPWPWTVNFNGMPLGSSIRGFLIGMFFIAVLAFGFLAVMWLFLQKFKEKPMSPVFVSAAFLAAPYAHYAYSRADVGHLAQGIFPLLVGCLVLLSTSETRIKWPFTIVLCTASFWVMYVMHPGWQCMANKCVTLEISGNKIKLDQDTANDITLLRRLANQYASNGQNFIVTPFWPGAYALLDRKSPMWEIYALFPRSEAFENKEINRIKAAKPAFAFVFDFPLDGRDDLRFLNTHPLIYQYIHHHFNSLPYISNAAYKIFKTKDLNSA